MSSDERSIADAVRRGLLAPKKTLPPFLFYDERGSALFEAITHLPSYYLTRTEREILERDAGAMARALLGGERGRCTVLELGAGTAEKTEILLRALVEETKDVEFFPADVSPSPLEAARARLSGALPRVRVIPVVATHKDALRAVRRERDPLHVVFLGSSLGNYDDPDAVDLLRAVRACMGHGGSLLVGLDRMKSRDLLLAAYDDPEGVTAAFNRNVLARINRELDGDFDLAAFRHVALFDEAAGAIEMHLESTRAHVVRIRALGLDVKFAAGERIHTESSYKYTEARTRVLFASAGLLQTAVFEDPRRWFSLHVVQSR